jgi:hypothetical protein
VFVERHGAAFDAGGAASSNQQICLKTAGWDAKQAEIAGSPPYQRAGRRHGDTTLVLGDGKQATVRDTACEFVDAERFHRLFRFAG